MLNQVSSLLLNAPLYSCQSIVTSAVETSKLMRRMLRSVNSTVLKNPVKISKKKCRHILEADYKRHIPTKMDSRDSNNGFLHDKILLTLQWHVYGLSNRFRH